MKDYPAKLKRLEHLNGLVEQHVPLMYASSEEGRHLHKEICEVYGEVEDVYSEIAGRQRIDVPNGNGPGSSMYPNFFEAGFLSGRSIHTHLGRTELLKVIGQVRRRSIEPQAVVRAHGNRVFLVHGHDEAALHSCARFIEKLVDAEPPRSSGVSRTTARRLELARELQAAGLPIDLNKAV